MSAELSLTEHLRDRHLNLALYPHVVVGDDRVVFPLWNLSGQRIGTLTYRPWLPKKPEGDDPFEKRYLPYISSEGGVTPALAVWGLESLTPDADIVFVCEGIFDACRLHNLGLSAIATLGNNPLHLWSWLRCLPQRKISVCDGDKAGLQLAKFGTTAILMPEGRDLGKLSNEEVYAVFAEFLSTPSHSSTCTWS